MGLILAGILAGALFAVLTFVCKIKTDDIRTNFIMCMSTLAVFSVIGGFALGIFEPVSGYGEPEIVSTTELVGLRDETTLEGTGGLFYVSVSGTNSYTYYVEIDSKYASNSQKAYECKTISNDKVVIVEDDTYTDAKMVTYVRYGNKSFWTFAAGAKQYEYVFYVPTGTIARDVSLG